MQKRQGMAPPICQRALRDAPIKMRRQSRHLFEPRSCVLKTQMAPRNFCCLPAESHECTGPSIKTLSSLAHVRDLLAGDIITRSLLNPPNIGCDNIPAIVFKFRHDRASKGALRANYKHARAATGSCGHPSHWSSDMASPEYGPREKHDANCEKGEACPFVTCLISWHKTKL